MLNKKEIEKIDWKELSKECSEISVEAKFTKADAYRIVKETREMQAKAKKYDILVEKIKDKIEDLGISDVDIYLQCELQELLKEVEDA